MKWDQIKTFAKLKEKGLTQEKVSRKAQISRGTMSAAFN
ncbi:MAG: helix-turn-helix transcriptional regulator [Lachnospiraceae bacterium]|nr:helix-turn-helix transcriptional regulator [Lachnospiraceae bacterium]